MKGHNREKGHSFEWERATLSDLSARPQDPYNQIFQTPVNLTFENRYFVIPANHSQPAHCHHHHLCLRPLDLSSASFGRTLTSGKLANIPI